MPYPTSGLYPDTWYPSLVYDSGTFGLEFDATTPALATLGSSAALATLDSTPALAAYTSSAGFDASLTGHYGDGTYGGGLYGTGNGTDYGLFDTTAAQIAALTTAPAMASYDTPEPAL